MSHSIHLQDAKTHETLHMDESFEDGGTYVVGGSDECSLNVTYNYGRHYVDVFPDEGLTNGRISWLYGKTGAETTDVLRAGITLLGAQRDADYWAATPGNAGAALARLLSFAAAHPEGVWRGD